MFRPNIALSFFYCLVLHCGIQVILTSKWISCSGHHCLELCSGLSTDLLQITGDEIPVAFFLWSHPAICVGQPTPPIFSFKWATSPHSNDPDILVPVLLQLGDFFSHPLESSLKVILTWINLPFITSFMHSCNCHFQSRLFVFEMLLRDWPPTDMSRYPHSGFISTVCSARSLCLQFCAGTVPVCQSPARNARQHGRKWWRRGEYLNHDLGGD